LIAIFWIESLGERARLSVEIEKIVIRVGDLWNQILPSTI